MSIGLGTALTASVALGKKVGDTADRLLDLEDITGMTTDSIQKWQNAAVVAGTSTEAMTNASEKLTKTMDTMSTGTGKAAEAARKLGYSYEELDAMNADERMNVLTTALQGVEDKTERARIGADLFGGSWKDMAPIVALGVDGLKDAKDNAIVFDTEALNAANKFRIGFDEIKKTIGNLVMKLAIEMMPMLNQFISFITDNMPTIQVIMKTVFDVVSKAINITIDVINEYFVPAIKDVYNWVQENMPIFQEMFRIAFEAILNVINAVWNILEATLIPVLRNLFNWVQENMPLIQQKFEEVFNAINFIVSGVVNVINNYFVPAIKNIYNWVQENMPIFQSIFELTFGTIWDVINAVWDVLEVLLLPILKGIFTWMDENSDTLGKLFSAPFIAVNTIIQVTIEFIENVIEKAKNAWEWLQKITNAETGAFSNGGSAKSRNSSGGGNPRGGETGSQMLERQKEEENALTEENRNEIRLISKENNVDMGVAEAMFDNRKRANGGSVNAGESYIVGEKEPELFVPNRNGMIYNQSQMKGLRGITQNITINSGKVLSPYEIAKRIKQESRKLAIEWG